MTRIALATALALMAASQTSAQPAPTRVARGTIAAFEVEHPTGPLRAKALRGGSSPVLVRVNPIGSDSNRYLVECFGVVEGEFDLAPLLEQADGRAAEGLPPLRVEVFTQLPPNPGTDLFGLPEPRLALDGGYRLAMLALAVAWVAIPVVVLVRRRLLRPPPPRPAIEPTRPTALDRLRELLTEARRTPLGVEDRGRLELLMLKALREAAGTADGIAEAVAKLRRDPIAAPTVREVERWLHAAGGEQHRAAAIDRLEGAANRGADPEADR